MDYNFNIPHQIKKAAEILLKNNFEAYLVGGSIRDFIMGIKPKEFDMATNATPEDMMSIFNHTVPTGIKHGTMLVIIGGMNIEITTFRSDGKYTDGRHPDTIEYAKTIEEDLGRRDFTMNAMALNMKDNTLIDLFDGVKDIEKKIVRAVGVAYDRFQEDGLRIMRAVRFASRLGFEIEKNTYKGITDSKNMLQNIANERIREEFNGIIISDNAFDGVEMLRKTGILEIIIPELLTGYGVEQNKYHKYDVYHHNLKTLAAVEKEEDEHTTLLIKLAALFHDIAKPVVKKNVEKQDEAVYYNHEIVGAAITRRIMNRLKYAKNDVAFVTLLIKCHMFYYQDEWTDGAVRRFMQSVGVENIHSLLKLREADRIGGGKRNTRESDAIPKLLARIDKIIEKENAITVKDLKINGSDLIKEFNLKEGVIIGRILNHLLEIILDEPEKNEYETLLSLAKEYVSAL